MTDYKTLIRDAFEAREKAYVPYSGFQVGAALLTAEGTVYKGCNIENASYGATNCAERTAFFKAVYEGERNFAAIAIVGGKKDGPPTEAYPCGICRQVMAEFCDLDTFEVIIAVSETDYHVFKLRDLLPHAFLPSNLE